MQGLTMARFMYERCVAKGDTAALPGAMLAAMPAAVNPNDPQQQPAAAASQPAEGAWDEPVAAVHSGRARHAARNAEATTSAPRATPPGAAGQGEC